MIIGPPPASGYLDTAGRELTSYPRPSIAVDVAVLTVPPGPGAGLHVVTIERTGLHRRGQHQLPGTFLHPGERLTGAALRALAEKAQLAGIHPRQVQVFDAPDRDDRGWVLSVAHLDVVPYERVSAALSSHVQLQGVDPSPGLAFDHDEIVEVAAERVRAAHLDRADPFALLPEPFTLLDLQRLHEAVAGQPLVKDSFRRRMQGLLEPTGEVRDGVVGKPARLWRRGRA